MDYDLTEIPAAYDRGHDHGPAVLDQWMAAIAAHLEADAVDDVLDLACGTGRFAPSLAARFDATVIGLDPSMKMLRQSQAKCAGDPRVAAVGGRGEALPIRARSIDLIFISMVFHHFDDPLAVARECERVLRPGGTVCLRTITRDQAPHYPYVPFFPGSRAALERRLPTLDATQAAFVAAGLRPLYAGIVVQEIAADYGAYADKLAAGADTSLATLDPREFAAGLSAMRATRAAASITEPIDFIVLRKAEDKA